MGVQGMFLPAVTAALCHPPAATDLTPCDRKFWKVCKRQCDCSSVRLPVRKQRTKKRTARDSASTSVGVSNEPGRPSPSCP